MTGSEVEFFRLNISENKGADHGWRQIEDERASREDAGVRVGQSDCAQWNRKDSNESSQAICRCGEAEMAIAISIERFGTFWQVARSTRSDQKPSIQNRNRTVREMVETAKIIGQSTSNNGKTVAMMLHWREHVNGEGHYRRSRVTATSADRF
jgi:hypothetical protein